MYFCLMNTPQNQDILGVIPARWASSRFPGKALAELNGRPIVLHVWDQCLKAGLSRVVIATDDQRILSVCQSAGANVMMTNSELPSGTDRCAAVALDAVEEFIINIQGDEPFIDPMAIRQVAELLIEHPERPIATLAKQESDSSRLQSPNVVKVVRDDLGRGLYFSRALIPFQRDHALSTWPTYHNYLTHIGLYGFQRKALLEIAQLPVTELEQMEQLEQLRWLSAGYHISVGITGYQSIGIDTPEDLEHARQYLLTL